MPIKGILGGAGVKPLGYGLGVKAEETDANFNQTTLLLHADGSEGAGDTPNLGDPNYKAFRDNSTSAHAIVVNGDAYGNDFSPYYYADGYWSIATNTAGNISLGSRVFSNLSGDKSWTIEGWIYYPDSGNAYTNLIGAYTIGDVNSTAIFLRGSGQSYEPSSISLATYGGSNITFLSPGSNSILHDAWFHFAFVRDSSNGNGYCFINGVLEQTVSFSATSFHNVDNTMNGGSNIASHNMYISNFRIVDGTAVYTSAFTPSTAPLTAITNTTFLMGQSNRFIDNSSSPVTITPNSGGAKISTNTPFTQSKTANVGSGFFDGTGDYLTATHATDFDFSGEFTAECWFYLADAVNWGVLFCVDTGDRFQVAVTNSDTIDLRFNGGATGTPFSINKHEWNHVAVTRDSSNVIRQFLNGVLKNTNTSSDSVDNGYMRIGANQLASNPFNGYIADVNIENGNCKYNTAFTPPTSTISADTDTKLLTCQYSGAVRNVGFVDDSKYNHQITRNGDVSMGTFSPFSLEDRYWSTYHDTASDAWVRFAGSGATDFNLDDGANWCVEFFLYMEDNSVAYERVAEHYNSADYWAIKFNNGGNGKICIGRTDTGDNGVLESASAIPENQWVHVAFTNDGSTLRLFVDGTLSNSASSWTQPWSNASGGTPSVQLGNYRSINGYQTRGYISNFRIVKGSSVYTSAFTVPTEPLTAIANTVLLCSQSNRHLDNSTNGYTATSGAATPPKILPFSPFAPSRSYSKDAVGGSAFFDASSDYLQLTNTNFDIFNFGTGEFLIEGWIYYNSQSLGSANAILGQTGWGNVLQLTSSGYLQFYQAASSGNSGAYWITGTSALPIGSWTHFALQRDSSGNLDMWVNGTREATNTTYASTTMQFHSAKGDITIHHWYGQNSSNSESISNLRIKNSAVYTSGASITVPTAPFTADANTVFLLSGNNAGIIDHTMKTTLETTGNTRIRTDVKKFGTGSIYLDGSDELNVPAGNKQIDFGTGQFTVEAFIRVESGSGSLGQWFTNEGEAGGWGSGGIAVYLQSSFTVWVNDASSGSNIMSYDGNYDDGVMRHYVWVRGTSGAMALFVDGTRVATYTWTGKVGTDIGFTIGNYKGGSRNLTGFIDEMRITKGVARYDPSQSSVTVPTEAFANR